MSTSITLEGFYRKAGLERLLRDAHGAAFISGSSSSRLRRVKATLTALFLFTFLRPGWPCRFTC